ncbi:MAG: hypothetical protein WCF67_23370, partial [Chitinophagaceae bacterium]
MRFFTLLLLVCAFTACKNTGDKKSDKPSVRSETGGGDVRNDISIKATGVTVEQAFLVFDESKKLVPEGNKVEVGQQVNMHLIIKGWNVVDSAVFLGASEKIATNDGQVFLDAPDLFSNYGNGINPADAGSVSLSAVITQVDKLFK